MRLVEADEVLVRVIICEGQKRVNNSSVRAQRLTARLCECGLPLSRGRSRGLPLVPRERPVFFSDAQIRAK